MLQHYYTYLLTAALLCEQPLCDDPTGTKVCRYNWHSAGSLDWTFPMPKYKYIFFKKNYTEAILSNSTRKLLWFEIAKMLKNELVVLFIIIFGILSFPMLRRMDD